MIAIDTNILVYAHRSEMPFHAAALERVRGLAEGMQPWALPWPVVHEFLAVTSNARIFRDPTPVAEGMAFLRALMESPQLHALAEGTGYMGTLEDVLRVSKVTGAMIHDARIAAICRFHHVRQLWSADRDHSRFEGIQVINPLLAER